MGILKHLNLFRMTVENRANTGDKRKNSVFPLNFLKIILADRESIEFFRNAKIFKKIVSCPCYSASKAPWRLVLKSTVNSLKRGKRAYLLIVRSAFNVEKIFACRR